MRKFSLAAVVAALFVTSSSSYAGPICDQFRSYYAAAQGPKAFAVGTKPCGYATSNEAPRSLEDVQARAVNFCAGYNGAKDCHVVASEGAKARSSR